MICFFSFNRFALPVYSKHLSGVKKRLLGGGIEAPHQVTSLGKETEHLYRSLCRHSLPRLVDFSFEFSPTRALALLCMPFGTN